MLTFSLENDYRTGQVKTCYSGKSEKQHSASNLGKVRRSALFGGALSKVDASGNWRAERDNHGCCSENKTQDAGEHGKISPLALIIITEHATLLKAVKMTLLSVTVFCICFAVTAGL